jgi:hypothetical protein
VQLAATYSVAAGTAHRAVAMLANEGIIEVARRPPGRRQPMIPDLPDQP